MMERSIQELLRRIPNVDVVLQTEAVGAALAGHPRKLVLESIREVLDSRRAAILGGEAVDLGLEGIVAEILARLAVRSDYTLKSVVNATGIVIHTNLGRSLLPDEAVERLLALTRSYNNLEYDLEAGHRGSRYVHAEAILCELTGAEAALVVNNNAGAVFLVLSTLAQGREVVVSRGQLVEIGGSFRIPDVMRASGAILREVGCTNRTHLRDYAAAVCDETALLMKVHTSNYRIIGFTTEVSLDALVGLGQQKGVPVVEDLGSGSFVDVAQFGLEGEPTVQASIRAGADVVTFSGDKLLGGPQAGIILGRKELVARCRKNPLTRAFRVDKMTLAALEATLRLYRDERQAIQRIPTLRMIAAPLVELEQRAHELAQAIAALGHGLTVAVEPSFSQVGGGSLPGQNLATRVVAIRSATLGATRLEALLRANTPPIIGRIESERLLLDVRTLQPHDPEQIVAAFRDILASLG